MLMNELDASEDASNCKLKIVHWHIESGNAEAFKMNDVVYKAVSIIIGTDMEHWYCANTGRNASHSYGSRFVIILFKSLLKNSSISIKFLIIFPRIFDDLV